MASLPAPRVIFGLDMDGCFFGGEGGESVAQHIMANIPLFLDMLTKSRGASEVIFALESNRQSKAVDDCNAYKRDYFTPSAFITMELVRCTFEVLLRKQPQAGFTEASLRALLPSLIGEIFTTFHDTIEREFSELTQNDRNAIILNGSNQLTLPELIEPHHPIQDQTPPANLPTVMLDRYLLSEIANPDAPGDLWTEALLGQGAGRHSVFDHTKISLFYAHAHHLMHTYDDVPTRHYFYDDRMDLLDGLKAFYGDDRTEYLPENLTLILNHYHRDSRQKAPNTVIKTHTVQGTGECDHDYHTNLHKLIELASSHSRSDITEVRHFNHFQDEAFKAHRQAQSDLLPDNEASKNLTAFVKALQSLGDEASKTHAREVLQAQRLLSEVLKGNRPKEEVETLLLPQMHRALSGHFGGAALLEALEESLFERPRSLSTEVLGDFEDEIDSVPVAEEVKGEAPAAAQIDTPQSLEDVFDLLDTLKDKAHDLIQRGFDQEGKAALRCASRIHVNLDFLVRNKGAANYPILVNQTMDKCRSEIQTVRPILENNRDMKALWNGLLFCLGIVPYLLGCAVNAVRQGRWSFALLGTATNSQLNVLEEKIAAAKKSLAAPTVS